MVVVEGMPFLYAAKKTGALALAHTRKFWAVEIMSKAKIGHEQSVTNQWPICVARRDDDVATM